MNNERLQDADEDSELSSEMSKSEDAYNDCSDSDINIPLAFTYFMTEEGKYIDVNKFKSRIKILSFPSIFLV